MNTEASSSRWWENYLVRYFMPSIAGIAIVAWLCSVGPGSLRETLFFGKQPASLDAPTLTLLVLYGNLFCYIASYPILCFHSTRALDFKNYSWHPRLTDGYVATAVFSILTLVTVLAFTSLCRVSILVALVAAFSAIQVLRFIRVLGHPNIQGFSKRPSPLIYAYLITLAMRRGVIVERTTTTTEAATSNEEDEDSSPSEKVTQEVEDRWKKDFVESYRHMREHGNSAFIFVLELTLAAICFGAISAWSNEGTKALSVVAIVLSIWSFPAVLVHMLGQHLERRYSIFDQKLDGTQV